MVRPRRPVDLPRCIEALGEVHRLDRYPMQWPADPAAWLQPPGLAAAWVAEQDGQVVGHIALVNSGDSMPPNGVAAAALPIAEISRLFVAPQARGGGLARALLDAVTARTGCEGRRPVLEVVDDAAAATRAVSMIDHRTRRPHSVREVTSSAFALRDATAADADQLTVLYLRSRVAAMPWLVSPHGEAATRWWMEHVVLRDHHVRVANDGDLLLGFTTVNGAWLDQLYVHPDHQGRGVGRILLREAKQMNPEGLSLHVFTRNDRARRFYEVAGFTLTAQSDGSRNEEQEPTARTHPQRLPAHPTEVVHSVR